MDLKKLRAKIARLNPIQILDEEDRKADEEVRRLDAIERRHLRARRRAANRRRHTMYFLGQGEAF